MFFVEKVRWSQDHQVKWNSPERNSMEGRYQYFYTSIEKWRILRTDIPLPSFFFFLLLPSLYLTILTMLSVWGKWNKYSLSDNKYFQISGDVLNRMLKGTGWLKERSCLKGVKGSSIHSSYGHVVPLNGLKGTSGCDWENWHFAS